MTGIYQYITVEFLSFYQSLEPEEEAFFKALFISDSDFARFFSNS